ncbi:MAG: alpha/beta hydrolase [Gemmatimonadota bacterium]
MSRISRARTLSLGAFPGLLAVGACAQAEAPAVETDRVASASFSTGSVAYYVPAVPRDVLVLVHGYPWPDDSRSSDQLIEHAESYVERWQPFAARERFVLVAPAFGSGDFAGYRQLFGRRVDADEFVNLVVDSIGGRFVADFDGRFYLYGHSAGGQFASRYVVARPHRLKGALLSAPSTYPFPDTTVQWPYGTAPVIRTEEFSGGPQTGKDPARSAGTSYRPDPERWVAAAAGVPIGVVVGSADIEPRTERRSQPGLTRVERARAWVDTMRALALSVDAEPVLLLRLVDGIAHDPVALTESSQDLLLELIEANR